MKAEVQVDTVVIGGGIAGLTVRADSPLRDTAERLRGILFALALSLSPPFFLL